MKNRKSQFILFLSLIIAITALLYAVNTNIQKQRQLRLQGEHLVELQGQLKVQHELLRVDTLLVAGKYEDALEQYGNEELRIVADGAHGIGLRVAIAERFLELQENTVERHEEPVDSVGLESDEIEKDILAAEVNQMDSLSFVLEKTKVQLTRLKKQLQQKSFGEYITFTNSKGSLVHYVGQVRKGKAHGYGVAILSTGSRYIGEWKDNHRHGVGTYHWKDGAYYEGEYENDKRNGQGTYYWPNGEKFVGLWEDDERTGEGTFYGKNSDVVASGLWEDDELVKEDKNSGR